MKTICMFFLLSILLLNSESGNAQIQILVTNNNLNCDFYVGVNSYSGTGCVITDSQSGIVPANSTVAFQLTNAAPSDVIFSVGSGQVCENISFAIDYASGACGTDAVGSGNGCCVSPWYARITGNTSADVW